jgi:hypothetical protein
VGSLFLAAVLLNNSGAQRHSNYPKPPAPAVRADQPASETKSLPRMDTVAMEREARELSALAASIPGDIEQVKKGLLPSDAIDKLKRIEKLSKELRQQIRP